MSNAISYQRERPSWVAPRSPTWATFSAIWTSSGEHVFWTYEVTLTEARPGHIGPWRGHRHSSSRHPLTSLSKSYQCGENEEPTYPPRALRRLD